MPSRDDQMRTIIDLKMREQSWANGSEELKTEEVKKLWWRVETESVGSDLWRREDGDVDVKSEDSDDGERQRRYIYDVKSEDSDDRGGLAESASRKRRKCGPPKENEEGHRRLGRLLQHHDETKTERRKEFPRKKEKKGARRPVRFVLVHKSVSLGIPSETLTDDIDPHLFKSFIPMII
ncbi:hypothetical protein LXL04_012762 [Taraxacum kok-saghyz]